MIVLRLFLLPAVILTACSLTATSPPVQVPTATTFRVVPATIVPTLARQLNVVPTATNGPPEATPVVECLDSDPLPNIQQDVQATLNYGDKVIQVSQAIRYVNRADEALDEIILGIEANQWPGAFSLQSVSIGTEPVASELTGRRLTVGLDMPLEPGCLLPLAIEFELQVPQVGEGLDSYRGYMGYSDRQLNLGHWLVTTVPRLAGEWLLHDAVLIGEQVVLETVDWDVTLQIDSAPESLEVAGPGHISQVDDHTWQFEMPDARDMTLSMSDQFRATMAETDSGVSVEMYSFDDAQVVLEDGTQVDAAAYALTTAVQTVEMYEDLYGPYPYERLLVVEGDFTDGMEFSGLVFVGRSYFTNFVGDPVSFLSTITVHEIAHQWWYAAVGSDQAITPWLDEALATYSEYVFIEEYYPHMKERWWQWRIGSYEPQGFVDSAVYDFASRREYINAVYLRGAMMMRDLREDMGTEPFFNLLRRYYEAGAGQIVSTDFFWSLLSAEESTVVQATQRRYFRPEAP